MNIALIVTDAGPLITLAVADALDTLKLLGARIVIPDMVHFEVTQHIDKPGARVFMAWLEEGIDTGLLLFEDSDVRKTNFLVRLPDNVLVLSTSTFFAWSAARSAGRSPRAEARAR